jgi:hypothetical protein
MWRVASVFFWGMISTALLTNALSVYVLHDVDRNMIGKWNDAFLQLTFELIILAVITSRVLGILIHFGCKFFTSRLYRPSLNPPPAIKKILDCFGLPSRPPPISSAVLERRLDY